MYTCCLSPTKLHNYSLTRCVFPGKGAVQEEIQKIIMECKMTNTKKLINYTVSSPPFHLYLHLAPHTLLCITNILKTLKKCRHTTTHLLNTCQLYTTIRSLAHVHMLPLTHKQLHNYSLTCCVCPGKGAVQEEIQKIIMECNKKNTKYVTNYTVSSTHFMLSTPQHGLQECNSTYALHNQRVGRLSM